MALHAIGLLHKDYVRNDGIGPGLSLCLHQLLDAIGGQIVVVRQIQRELSAQQRHDAHPAEGHKTFVLLLGQDVQTAVALLPLAQQGQCAVRRAVIDHPHLNLAACLAKHTLQRLADAPLGIVCGDKDGDEHEMLSNGYEGIGEQGKFNEFIIILYM